MRLALATAACAVMGALLAGCSISSQGSSGPLVSAGTAQTGDVFPRAIPDSGLALLRMQAEGKLPGPVPIRILRAQLKQLETQPRPHFNLRPDAGGVQIWSAMTDADYVLGSSASGKKINASIDTETQATPGYYPTGLKVDHARNLWVANEVGSFGSSFGGVVQEYTNGTFANAYSVQCPSSAGCKYMYSASFDVAVNSKNVFAALEYMDYEVCNPSCVAYDVSGFEYWPNGSPSSKPTLIALNYRSPVVALGWADVDSSGNLWFTDSGYYDGSHYGYGLVEITNPTTNPTFTQVEPPGTYSFWGGVYVSGRGKTLNVIDEGARKVYQYALPLSPSGTPFNTLTPCQSGCDPTSGGFNKGDKKMVIGDANDWLDIGTVATNHWKQAKSPQMNSSLSGAAYTPSDK